MNLADRNHADQEALELEHGRFVDQVNDRAITLQDAAYELGRKRGKAEADADMLAALRAAVAFIEGAPDAVEPFALIRAAIAKATGVAS
jgi:hypothetical protein